MATAKPTPQQVAQQAAAAAKAKNAAIQAPVSNTPAPNMAALQRIAPSVAASIAKKVQPPPTGPFQAVPATARPADLQRAATMPAPPRPPVPSRPSGPLYYDANRNVLNPGGGMVGYDEGVYNADGTPLNPLVTGPRPGYLQDPNFLNYQKQATDLGLQLKDYMMNSPLYQQQLSLEQAAQAQFGQGLSNPSGLGQIALLQQSPEFQKYQQQRMDLDNQLNAYQQNAPMYKQLQDVVGKMNEIQRTTAYAPPYVQPAVQGLSAMAARPVPRQNPMTGLGAFAANPNIGAANPFATLGLTMGAQQAQQNVQPPYNPMMNTFQGNQQVPSGFGQSVAQLFQGLGGQAQTQQSPYSQQQASNLMQNIGQVGQNAYGSFVGQQRPQQQQTQQMQQPQQTAQTSQSSVAPPMQAGFNFFGQDQNQGNTGGGTTGGGGLF